MEKRDTELEQRLSQALDGLRLGKPCYAFQELPSTMDLAHELAAQGASEGTCVWAEQQTAGRGRAGRTWASPPGGIYLSVILRPSRPVSELPQLSLVAGLACAEALRDGACLYPSIRWPNDLLLDGKKVGGILTEAKDDAVIVGIGINVTTKPHDLPEGATALTKVPGTFPRIKGAWHFRVTIAAALFRHLEQTYQQWNREGFTAVRPALIPWIGLFGRLVHITTSQHTAASTQHTESREAMEFEGQALDVDDSGRLLVRLDSGIVRAFEVGEVTLLH